MSVPTKTGLLELLRNSSGSQFVIPVYQRNYTWTAERDVKQYLHDLDCVVKGQYEKHFLGIVIYLEKSIDFSSRELSIIDGQQRLTTTFLIIYAVKKLFELEGNNAEISKLEGQYLTNPYSEDKLKYKLKPLVSDDDVYRCIIEDRINEIIDTDSNVLKNYNYISEHLNTLLSEGYTANDILMALDKLYVVTVPISEDENVQKIFESINATGEKLTAADLIRNFLLMDLDSDTQEEYYAKYWKKLESNISSDSKELELFFRMYLSIKIYSLIAKNNIYRGFVEWVNNEKKNIKELFENLLMYSKIYYQIRYENIESIDKSLREPIVDYRKIDSDMPLGMFMEFYALCQKGDIDVNILSELIKSTNAYMIRRSLCDIDGQNISRLFPTVLKNVLDQCAGDYSNILKVFNQILVGDNATTSGSYMPTDQQMYDSLINASVYGRTQLRTVLDRLELHNNSAPVDLSKLSIEHLMPQTPTEEWLAELDTDEETYYNNLHRLGNLTLAAVSDNSKMKNLGWNYKNEILKGTNHLTLNAPLLEIEQWDIKCINDRTEELIEDICELYPYPNVSVAKSSKRNSVDKDTTTNECVDYICNNRKANCIREKKTYKTDDKNDGYILLTSKMYIQGNRESFWFGYRAKRLKDIKECENKYLVLGCCSTKPDILMMPISFLESKLDNLIATYNDEGKVKHHHIKLFKDNDGKYSLLLSKPNIEEIDITNFLIGKE